MQEKVRKLFESRSKAEDELRKIQQKVDDAVENKDRRVRVERLVSSCDEAMTIFFESMNFCSIWLRKQKTHH